MGNQGDIKGVGSLFHDHFFAILTTPDLLCYNPSNCDEPNLTGNMVMRVPALNARGL